MKTCVALALAAAYRVALWACLRTTYVPDEYYQHLEPAVAEVFGQGIRTWEWQPEHRIRSYLTVLPAVWLFRLLDGLGNDSLTVVQVCRALQLLLVLASDYCYLRLCKKLVGESLALYAFAFNLCSWSCSYMLPRTLANSVEYCLVIIGSYWLMDKKQSHLMLGMFVAALSVFLRPTSALYWLPLGSLLIASGNLKLSVDTVLTALAVGLCSLEIGAVVDTAFYGQATLSPWNFFRSNILEAKALAFGVKPWHFHLTEGLPVMLGLYSLLFFYSLLVPKRQEKPLPLLALPVFSSLLYIVFLSLSTRHQEHRFILPALPFLHLLLADRLRIHLGPLWKKAALVLVFTAHVLLAGYLLTFHQAGGEKAMHLLRTRYLPDGQVSRILLAAPCYSLPGYAHIHTRARPVQLLLPNCSLPWDGSSSSIKESERTSQQRVDQQQEAIAQWINAILPEQTNASVFVVTFDVYLPALQPILQEAGMRVVEDVHHAHFVYDLDDPLPKKRLVILAREVQAPPNSCREEECSKTTQ